MMQTIQEDLILTIVIKRYDDLPEESRYLGFIEKFNGTTIISPVEAKSVGEVLKEIGTSINVLESYLKNK